MSASLITFIHASLQQGRASDAEGPWKTPYPTVAWRSAVGPVEPVLVKREAVLPPAWAGNAAECLQQLVAAVTKLSDVDQMLEQVQQTVPAEDGAAQKWYQVSLTSLQWTRKAQAERIQAILKELKSVMLALQGAAAEAPTSIPEDARLFSMPPEEPICDVPRGLEVQVGGEDDPGRRSQIDKVGSLRNDLETIKERDPGCCLMVRNIKRLGLESADALRAHFGCFGEVAEVLCAHSLEKPNAKRRHGRVRPAALGFVVMAGKEGAEKVLAAGSDQTVGDVCINVRLMRSCVDGEPQGTD